MSKVQVIEKDGKPEYDVVPAALWNKVRAAAENAEAAAAFDAAVAADDGIRIPAVVAFAIADGVHPVRAWRDQRGLSQDAVALASGISKPLVNQIESGKRAGTITTLKKLAAAFDVPVQARPPSPPRGRAPCFFAELPGRLSSSRRRG